MVLYFRRTPRVALRLAPLQRSHPFSSALLPVLLLMASGFVSAPSRALAPGTITTIAGTGKFSPTGNVFDNGPAAQAILEGPRSAVVDSNGNIIIADRNNNRIRKIDTSGIITTIAGGGVLLPGDSDGHPATQAKISTSGVAVDAQGNVYFTGQTECITDSKNFCTDQQDLGSRVYKVGVDGILHTVAGTGVGGFSGDGGLATDAKVFDPQGVAIDPLSGDLFIGDHYDNRIRRVNKTSGIITTYSTSVTDFLTFNSDGTLYASQAGSAVYKVNLDGSAPIYAGGGFPSGPNDVGDGGPATNGVLSVVYNTAVDGGGNLYIADINQNRIRKVDACSGIITTVAGAGGDDAFSGDGGLATLAHLSRPEGVTVDGEGNLLIVDTGNDRIRMVAKIAVPVKNAGGLPFPAAGNPPTAVPDLKRAGIANGNFTGGKLDNWSIGGINNGGVRVEQQGVPFANSACSDFIPFPNGKESHSANVRSNTNGDVGSIGLLTSDPFVPNNGILRFKALSESTNVDAEVLLLKPTANLLNPAPGDILKQQAITSLPGPGSGKDAGFTTQIIDVSAFYNADDSTLGTPMRLQIRQHTTEAGKGHFTLVTGFDAGPVEDFPEGWVPNSPTAVSAKPTTDKKTGEQVLRIGKLTVRANNITVMGNGLRKGGSRALQADPNVIKYELSGKDININQFLHFDGGIELSVNKATAVAGVTITGGELYLDSIPLLGHYTLWQGQNYSFQIDGNGQITSVLQEDVQKPLRLAGIDVTITHAQLLLTDDLGIQIDGKLNFAKALGINGLNAAFSNLRITRSQGLKFDYSIGLPDFNINGFGLKGVHFTYTAGADPTQDVFMGKGTLVTPAFKIGSAVKLIGGSLDSIGARVEGFSLPIPPVVITAGEIDVQGLRQPPFSLYLSVDLTIGSDFLANFAKLSHAGIRYTAPSTFTGDSDLDLFTAKIAQASFGIDFPKSLSLGANTTLINSFQVLIIGFNVKAGVDNTNGSITPFFEGDANGTVQVPNGDGFPYNALKALHISLPFPIASASVGVHKGVFSSAVSIHLADILSHSIDLGLNAKIAPTNGIGANITVGTNFGNLPTIHVGAQTVSGGPRALAVQTNEEGLRSMHRDQASMGGNPLEGHGLYVPVNASLTSARGGSRLLQDGPQSQDLAKVTVAAGTPQAIFRVAGSVAPRFDLVSPDGLTTITPDNAYSDSNPNPTQLAVFTQFTGTSSDQTTQFNESYYIVPTPQAGDWLIRAEDSTQGPFVLDGFGQDLPPAVNSISASAASNGKSTISYNVSDPDTTSATVSLYYDDDNTGTNGHLIVDGLSKSTAGSYVWDFSDGSVPAGNYYVYALADDGELTDHKYTATKVTITDPNAPATPTGVAVQSGPANNLFVSWNPVNDPKVTGYRVTYAKDNGPASVLDQNMGAGTNTSITLTHLSDATTLNPNATPLADNTAYRVAVIAYGETELPDPNNATQTVTTVHESLPSASQVGTTGVANPPVVHLTLSNDQPIAGHDYTFAWEVNPSGQAAGNAPSDQQVELSTDFGVKFTVLQAHLDGSARSFKWTVPDSLLNTGFQVKVSAMDAAGNEGHDISSFLSVGSPVPTITSATPGVLIQNQDAEVQIMGSDFATNASASLQFSGATLSVHFFHSGHVSVTIPASALSNFGSRTLTIFNPNTGQSASTPIFIGQYGDINGDGNVDIQDVVKALNILVGLDTATDQQLTLGDVRPNPGTGGRLLGDGQIDSVDVNWLLRRVVGLTSTTP